MKAKILTTVKIKKEWLDEIAAHMPGIEFEIHQTKQKLQMWYNPLKKSNYGVFTHLRQILNAPTGYRYRVYVMSEAERKAYGIKDHYACYDNLDRDGVLDFYMSAGDNSAKTKKNGFKHNFARRFIHEVLHGKEQERGREYLAYIEPDRTHEWESEGRLKDLIKEHYRLKEIDKKIVTLQEMVINLLQRLKLMTIAAIPTLLHPLPKELQSRVTQPYGIASSLYKLTGRHLGTDYGIPVNTPIYAPYDGEMTVSGYTSAQGYFCHFQYTYQGQQYTDRYLHLKEKPLAGMYKRGSIIARTGNTGMSTGPHIHIEVWKKDVDLTIINTKNWAELTFDPQLHYKN